MDIQTSMNGKNMDNFKNSYTLMCLVEETLSMFSKMNVDEKKNLCERIDKLFSELFSVERGEIVYEDKEYTLDTEKVYLGQLNKINSGMELLFRYIFQKRQQFQRICIKNNNQRDYQADFNLLKDSYSLKPVSKEKCYIPYSQGLTNYLGNFNKIDALVFSFVSKEVLLSMIDKKRVFSDMSLKDSFSLIFSVYKIQKFEQKVIGILSLAVSNSSQIKYMFKKYLDMVDSTKNEKIFLKTMESVLDSWEDSIDKEEVLLCFHENVWANLSSFQRRQAINICNEFIAEILGCDKLKNVKYSYGKNSYDFEIEQNVYVGDIIKDKPHEILQRLIYEYSFIKNHENIFKLDEETSQYILKSLDDCAEVLHRTGDYGSIRDYEFIKNVKKTATGIQKDIYRYICDNLVINGKKVKMNISKDEFVLDLYKSKIRR